MHKSSGKSENIIDRVISKFKMAKRGSQRTTSVNQAEFPEEPSLNDTKLNDPESQDTKEIDTENLSVSLENLPGFCDQLEKFIKYVRNVQDLQFFIYDYPAIVRNRFDNDVLELECMLREINAAVININKQKAQSNYIKKEKISVKKSLNKIRDEESREMEKVAALYDKSLFTRWENAKTTHKPEILKNLLTDIKCKQLALENLDTLVTRKLGHLKAFSSTIADRNDKSDKEKTVIPLPFFPLCPAINDNSNQRKSRIPVPPPLPPPPSLTARNNAQNFSNQRQRRLEREENLDSQYSFVQDIDNLLIIPPLTFENVPDNFIVSLEESFHSDALSPYFSNDNSIPRDGSIAASLQNEMHTVVQALFGHFRARS